MSADPPRVYFDSNVFIAALENVTAHSDHAWWLLNAMQDGEILGVTSEITLAEVLVKPIERGAGDMVAAYENIISDSAPLNVLAVTRSILIDAAAVRAGRASIKLPDAIHIATARASRCKFFVTDDLRMTGSENLTTFRVNPFTLDDILKGVT